MTWGRTTPEQEPKSIRDLADRKIDRTPRPAIEFPNPRTDTDQEDQ